MRKHTTDIVSKEGGGVESGGCELASKHLADEVMAVQERAGRRV